MSQHGSQQRGSGLVEAGAIVYVGIGSNVGRRPEQIRHGLERLRARGMAVEAVSSLYLTEPVVTAPRGSTLAPSEPIDAGPWYVNCVARLRVDIRPEALLRLLLDVERLAGRVREDTAHRSAQRAAGPGPTPRELLARGQAGVEGAIPEVRTLDLDLLLYGDLVADRPGLRVPHPRMQERRFVLEPLCELDPEVPHPEAERTVASLLDKLPEDDGVWLLAPPPVLR